MIEVHHEPIEEVGDLAAIENCCFCRESTRFWYKPRDVACCEKCAAKAEPEDVPDKKTWCRREQIAFRGMWT